VAFDEKIATAATPKATPQKKGNTNNSYNLSILYKKIKHTPR